MNKLMNHKMIQKFETSENGCWAVLGIPLFVKKVSTMPVLLLLLHVEYVGKISVMKSSRIKKCMWLY
jgi:hypothetical protein